MKENNIRYQLINVDQGENFGWFYAKPFQFLGTCHEQSYDLFYLIVSLELHEYLQTWKPISAVVFLENINKNKLKRAKQHHL